jgi:hypothetical protein
VTYGIANADAPAAVRGIGAEPVATSAAAVAFEQHGRAVSSVVVRPGGRERVEVRVVADAALPDGALYGGYLVFTPDGGGQPVRVPYAGYKGDYQAAPALTPTGQGYPWLARKTGLSLELGALRPVYARAGGRETFTFASSSLPITPPLALTRSGTDQPVVLVHLENPAQRLRIDVFNARRGKRIGEAYAADFLPRNAPEIPLLPSWALVTQFPLDGTVRLGGRRVPLPDGDYFVKLTVERALAERRTPIETWTSPTFRIDRS